MPKKIHDSLEKQAESMGLDEEAKRAYIYGTLQRIEKRKKKGR